MSELWKGEGGGRLWLLVPHRVVSRGRSLKECSGGL